MSKHIIIHYVDGTTEEYYGDLDVGNKGIMSIFPQNERMSVKIPISQIKKYEVR